MKVKAAVAKSPGDALVLDGLTLAEPQSDEVLVKMIACGVSRADLDAIDGRLAMPFSFVPGSEGAGIVEGSGANVKSLTPGDAVIIGFDYCGRCPPCTAGQPRSCVVFADYNLSGHRTDRSVLFQEGVGGRFFGQSSFATHVVCRASRAVKVARGSPLEALACLGGEFLIGAGTVLNTFAFQEGDSLVVSGAGAAGLAATMTARALGAATIVIAEADERRRKLASELGADVAVHTDDNLVDIVRSLAADGATFALETTGAPHARQACVESLAVDGTCAFTGPFDASDFGDGQSTTLARLVSADAHAPPSILVPKLAAMHARGDLPLEHLVDFFPFEHVNDALQALRSGMVAKPVLRFSIGAFGDLDRANVEGARADAPDADPSSSNESAPKPTLVE